MSRRSTFKVSSGTARGAGVEVDETEDAGEQDNDDLGRAGRSCLTLEYVAVLLTNSQLPSLVQREGVVEMGGESESTGGVRMGAARVMSETSASEGWMVLMSWR